MKALETMTLAGSIVTLSIAAHAAPKFTEAQKCGSAKVVNFTSCNNNSIEFNFDGCLLKSEPQKASKVTCKGNTVTARYATPDFRYEVVFEKTDDGWGAIEWKPKSNLRQWQAQTEVKKVTDKAVAASHRNEQTTDPVASTPPAKQEIAREPASTPEPTKPSALQFSGFADIRLTSLAVKDYPTWNGSSESGYTLDDGKLAFSYSDGPTELIADIPFRRAKNIDANPSMSPPDYGSSNSTVLFGTDKLQFYGKYKFADNFAVWAGQYDTPYGVELNDSKDRIFSKTGLVYDEMLPVTHTGLLLETNFAGNSVKVFSANSNNKGSLGNSTSGDNNYEYGVTWGYANEYFRVQLGALSRPITKASGSDLASRSLTDLTIGGTFGWVSIDAELAQITDPSKNVLTASDSSDQEKAGMGALALITISPWESWAASVRVESLQDAPSANSDKQKMTSAGANLKWKISPHLETRLEYTNSNFEKTDSTKWSTQRGILSAIFSY